MNSARRLARDCPDRSGFAVASVKGFAGRSVEAGLVKPAEIRPSDSRSSDFCGAFSSLSFYPNDLLSNSDGTVI